MVNLRFWLGLIPGTDHIEQQMKSLEDEYSELLEFADSVTWKRYEELNQEVNSEAFARKLKEIGERKFEDTPEYTKYQRWKSLRNDSAIKTYFKVKKSGRLARFQLFETSGKPGRLKELETVMSTDEFHAAKSLPKKEFHASSFFATEHEYKKLIASKEYRFWSSFKQSSDYKIYIEIKDSQKLTEYAELETYVSSDAFIKLKKDLELPAKKKIELSEDYHIVNEFKQLAATDKVKWYLANRDHKKFDWLKKWKLQFADDFNDDKLDTDKWMTRYYYGDTLLGQGYSLDADFHYNTDGDNVETASGICSIVTRKQNVTGQAWNPAFGFMPKEFEVTSGLISTGKSFRSTYGVIKAKVRFNSSYPVTHAFWLSSSQILPQIDVFKFDRKKLSVGSFFGNPVEENGAKQEIGRLSASKLEQGYWIIELEWSPNQLTWRVNGLVVKTQTDNIPNEPMYLVFSSGLYRNELPGASVKFDIDWVRWYQSAQ
jgi:beta-glucanase (GH16 family)